MLAECRLFAASTIFFQAVPREHFARITSSACPEYQVRTQAADPVEIFHAPKAKICRVKYSDLRR